MKLLTYCGLAVAGYTAGAAGSVGLMRIILVRKYRGYGIAPEKETKWPRKRPDGSKTPTAGTDSSTQTSPRKFRRPWTKKND